MNTLQLFQIDIMAKDATRFHTIMLFAIAFPSGFRIRILCFCLHPDLVFKFFWIPVSEPVSRIPDPDPRQNKNAESCSERYLLETKLKNCDEGPSKNEVLVKNHHKIYGNFQHIGVLFQEKNGSGSGLEKIIDPVPVCLERLYPVCPERLDPDPVNIILKLYRISFI